MFSLLRNTNLNIRQLCQIRTFSKTNKFIEIDEIHKHKHEKILQKIKIIQSKL
jgi:hypothetical protein